MPITYLEPKNIMVVFQEDTYIDLMSTINSTSLEVTFSGIVTKTKTDSSIIYSIDKVLYPPQWNEPAETKTLDSQYPNWLFNKSKELGTPLKLKGHSHPKMSVTPSGYDITYYKELKQSCKTFFIRMIANQSGAIQCDIYDIQEGFEYTDALTYILTKHGFLLSTDNHTNFKIVSSPVLTPEILSIIELTPSLTVALSLQNKIKITTTGVLPLPDMHSDFVPVLRKDTDESLTSNSLTNIEEDNGSEYGYDIFGYSLSDYQNYNKSSYYQTPPSHSKSNTPTNKAPKKGKYPYVRL